MELNNEFYKEVIKRDINGISEFISENYEDAIIKKILFMLSTDSRYADCLTLISKNNLDEEYLEYLVKKTIKLNNLSNKIFEQSDAKELFSLLYYVIEFESLEKFDIDVTKYKNIIEKEILRSRDNVFIVKTGIYLDNYLLSLLFKEKKDLFEYLVINDYSTQDIETAKNILEKEEDKEKVEKILDDVVSKINTDLLEENSKRFKICGKDDTIIKLELILREK